MSKVEQIESQIKELSSEELAAFRQWFSEFDSRVWDGSLKRMLRPGNYTSSQIGGAAGPHCREIYQAVNHHASPDFWACYRALPASGNS